MTGTSEVRPFGNGRISEPPQGSRDDTTRYLCAAAHLDSNYADQAIREFLNEETRPVPPSPGVDAAAVLGEAVAARTRRKLRDVALIALMIVFAILAPTALLIGWVLVALLFMVPKLAAGVPGMANLSSKRNLIMAVGGVLVLIIGWNLIGGELSALFGSSSPSSSSSDFSDFSDGSGSSGVTIGTILVLLAILAVLLTDRFVVWRHLSLRFWRNPLNRTVPRYTDERPVFQFSPNRFVAQLRRYVDPRPTIAGDPQYPGAGTAPLIVYRGFKPFVGAGELEDPWSIAVPLEPLPDAEPKVALTTESLYAAIGQEIANLKRAVPLAPGRRLRELTIGEQVIVSSDELIDHLNEPSAVDFLRSPQVAPFTMIRGERVRSIKMDPLEWARYYQCYQVETWDRDLVLSVFVHVAVGDGALYVEWTPCILLPIKKQYQQIDQMSRSPMLPVGQALLELIRLPAAIPGKFAHTVSFIRPQPRERGSISPDTYGVASSLRELAADSTVHNYFQLTDTERYVKMLESRLVLAVSRIMRDAGYSPASFDQQAATVINNNVQIGGSVGGTVVAGMGNRITPGPAAASRPTATGRAAR
jgi:hypothetical protein